MKVPKSAGARLRMALKLLGQVLRHHPNVKHEERYRQGTTGRLIQKVKQFVDHVETNPSTEARPSATEKTVAELWEKINGYHEELCRLKDELQAFASLRKAADRISGADELRKELEMRLCGESICIKCGLRQNGCENDGEPPF